MERNKTHPAVISFMDRTYISIPGVIDVHQNVCLFRSLIIKRTHVSIWKWVQKYANCAADRFKVNKHLVKEIFFDETLIQIEMVDKIIGVMDSV